MTTVATTPSSRAVHSLRPSSRPPSFWTPILTVNRFPAFRAASVVRAARSPHSRVMPRLSLLFACCLGAAALACASGTPLEVAPALDVQRYLGRWYAIASFPQRFQEGCVATTADYSLRDDGQIRVENRCRTETLDGEERSATGVAWQTDPENAPAKLRVSFFWPFYGAYWIIDLDADYQYAVVGHPSREYLWILSRTPQMEPALFTELVGRVEKKGFDPARLNRTLQPKAVDQP